MSEQAAPFILPPALIGRADLARLVREVEALDNDLEAQKVRAHSSGSGYHMPTMSRSLSDFLDMNKLDLSDDQARMQAKERLREFKDKAPVVHLTFATDADPEVLQQLVTYFRTEIHPQTLLSIGLQPNLVGGVYVRTPNHVHDFSVRALLKNKRDIMVHEIEGLLA